MARGLNTVLLIGVLEADPEVRFTPNGTPVADARLATHQTWKDEGGQLQERIDWHRLVFWGRLAEIARQYLRKGCHVHIEGQLTTRSCKDERGQQREVTEIMVRDMHLLDGRRLPDQDATEALAVVATGYPEDDGHLPV